MPINLRTSAETAMYAEQAVKVGEPVRGVYGFSILSSCVPDYLHATAIDIMHAVFEGVSKRLLNSR